jgi:hypothetical protein
MGDQAFEQIETIELVRSFVDLEEFGVPEDLFGASVLAESGLAHQFQRQLAVPHGQVRTGGLGQGGPPGTASLVFPPFPAIQEPDGPLPHGGRIQKGRRKGVEPYPGRYPVPEIHGPGLEKAVQPPVAVGIIGLHIGQPPQEAVLGHLGQEALNPFIRQKGPPPDRRLFRIGQGPLQGPPGGTGGKGAYTGPGCGNHVIHIALGNVPGSFVDGPSHRLGVKQHLIVRDEAILEKEDTGRADPLSHLVFMAAQGKTRRSCLDDQTYRCVRRPPEVRVGVQDKPRR